MGALDFGKVKTAAITGALMVNIAATAPAQTKKSEIPDDTRGMHTARAPREDDTAPWLEKKPSVTAKHGAKAVPLKKLGHAEADKHMQQKGRKPIGNIRKMPNSKMKALLEDDTAPWLLGHDPSVTTKHGTEAVPQKKQEKHEHDQKKLPNQHKKGLTPGF